MALHSPNTQLPNLSGRCGSADAERSISNPSANAEFKDASEYKWSLVKEQLDSFDRELTDSRSCRANLRQDIASNSKRLLDFGDLLHEFGRRMDASEMELARMDFEKIHEGLMCLREDFASTEKLVSKLQAKSSEDFACLAEGISELRAKLVSTEASVDARFRIAHSRERADRVSGHDRDLDDCSKEVLKSVLQRIDALEQRLGRETKKAEVTADLTEQKLAVATRESVTQGLDRLELLSSKFLELESRFDKQQQRFQEVETSVSQHQSELGKKVDTDALAAALEKHDRTLQECAERLESFERDRDDLAALDGVVERMESISRLADGHDQPEAQPSPSRRPKPRDPEDNALVHKTTKRTYKPMRAPKM